MSMKNLSEEKKLDLWILRRAEWWAERRMGRNSEDVWRAKLYVSSLLSLRYVSTMWNRVEWLLILIDWV